MWKVQGRRMRRLRYMFKDHQMAEDKRGGLSEGIRTGIGILTAVKEALTETIDEAVARGDLSQEKARAVFNETAQRIQVSLEEARDRLDLISRKEVEALRLEILELRGRIEALEKRQPPPLLESPARGPIPID
jgi:polyhydroxyalkanoate synthesis regulator phasin